MGRTVQCAFRGRLAQCQYVPPFWRVPWLKVAPLKGMAPVVQSNTLKPARTTAQFTDVSAGCSLGVERMKKILVIEDEPEMRRNITTVLRLEDFQPFAAENGRVGLALAKKEKPDLILC